AVAGMDEEVWPVVEHGRKGAHAAALLVDAPALAGSVARPAERYRAPLDRRGAEAPDERLAGDRGRREVGERHPVEDVLSARQSFKQRLGGEISVRQRVRGPFADQCLE